MASSATDLTPFYADETRFTAVTSAAVTGLRLVKITAARANGLPTVAHAGAGEEVVGVAGRDAASGANVTVFRPGQIIPCTVGASNVSAGAAVKSDANGKLVAATAASYAVGYVLDDAVAGAAAMLDFRPFTVPA